MPSLKEYNVKLARLRSTRKLTRTMKLVSANKLRRAQEAEKRLATYAKHVDSMLARIAAEDQSGQIHPLLKPRRRTGSVLVLAIASDRGLCGGFNNSLLRETLAWITGRESHGCAVSVSCCGRKAHAFLKNRCSIDRYYEHSVARPDFAAARHIGHELIAGFMSGRLDEIYIAFNKPTSQGGAKPAIDRLIPIDTASLPAPDSSTRVWAIEPDVATVLDLSLPALVNLRIFQCLLANATGEHGARMRAMDQAGSNADNLIRSLTLQRNRARQAQITTELTEIVAGAEALK